MDSAVSPTGEKSDAGLIIGARLSNLSFPVVFYLLFLILSCDSDPYRYYHGPDNAFSVPVPANLSYKEILDEQGMGSIVFSAHKQKEHGELTIRIDPDRISRDSLLHLRLMFLDPDYQPLEQQLWEEDIGVLAVSAAHLDYRHPLQPWGIEHWGRSVATFYQDSLLFTFELNYPLADSLRWRDYFRYGLSQWLFL